MPDLVEQMYCSQQIHIPPAFPDILKQYTKAAIRTQPRDLLKWSASYFRALANGEYPPVKERLEFPPPDGSELITPGMLKVLHNQLSEKVTISTNILAIKWDGLCLPQPQLERIMEEGRFEDETVEWLKFLAVTASHIGKTLTETMTIICEIVTEEPEGGSASIPISLFRDLYLFLASLDGPSGPDGPVPDHVVIPLLEYLDEQATKQDGMIMPRNFTSPYCPPLQ